MIEAAHAPGLADDYQVLTFALNSIKAGQGTALATIVNIDGPFSRPLGAQLAIAEDGSFAGSISGGCLEQALVEEAQKAILDGTSRTLRYGVGSPFIDVRLPCGGGLDIHLDPRPEVEVLERAIESGRKRQGFTLRLDIAAGTTAMRFLETDLVKNPNHSFDRHFLPSLKLVLAGRGWEIVALAGLATKAGFEVIVASQEAATLKMCARDAAELLTLTTPQNVPTLSLDAQSALVCLFHEHEWETKLLMDALSSPAFYVGALGSQSTHANRLEILEAIGASPDQLARLHGPIGLFRSHDPSSLAVSTLAQILSLKPRPSAAMEEANV